jgi:multidrug efflux pump subunit AcrA (membrane-fusion protein)
MKLLGFVLIASLALVFGCSRSAITPGAAKYHCPMHPTVVSDKPGDCPICGMQLVSIEKEQVNPKPAAKFHCPMHPTVVSDKPGDCRICGMKLVPLDSGKEQSAAPKKKSRYRSTMNANEVSDKPGKDSMGMDMVAFAVSEGGDASTVPGLATVSITPSAQERMGMAFGKVEKRPLDREVRTSARIVADETRLYRVSVKFEGWVDKLFAAVTGQQVKKGDPLLTVYSPELVSAQEELLIAVRLPSENDSLKKASRRRLENWDVSAEQIDRLEKSGTVEKTLTIYAPADGVVLDRMVLPGQKLTPNDPLMVIADLSQVWADADIYQSDLTSVKEGTPVEFMTGDKKFSGKVTFITPTLDPATRTMKARFQIPNPELFLKPEMYGTAKFAYELGQRLAIPDTAVMRTGTDTYAFKSGDDNRLIPVQITTGARSDGWVEVIDGLSEGDQVVTSANFLVDSESSMKAALASRSGGGAHQH